MTISRRNILLLLIFALCGVSCTTSTVIQDTRVPEVEIDSAGQIWIHNQRVEVGKIGKTLRSAGFQREQEVNILIPNEPDRMLMKAVSANLVRSGFTRSAFVKAKSATSTTLPAK
ncbi:MAG: hypothetical protein PHO37_17325 [Kiritimatiellae bacterium]|nr:hypothetical protein [Kiritimatiellia bacterium]